MQFATLYKDTVSQLRTAGIDDAETDALLLLEFCFGLTRSKLFLDGSREVPDKELERFALVLKRRVAREPLHYITGTREFWSLDFIVSPAVLVPRPETEFVLETVLALVKKSDRRYGSVLDMCTGSGVIAVVLARELGLESILAVDSSPEALSVAAKNVLKHGLGRNIMLLCADLFTALRKDCLFGIIVVNPPYIADPHIAGLQPEVRDWEPRAALTAGEEGLDVIRRIAAEAHMHLVPGGWLFMEIGADQEESVLALFSDRPGKEYVHAEVLSDWSGRPRLLKVQRREIDK